MAYVMAAVREIVRNAETTITVTVDGHTHQAGLAIVTHASHYAGPFVISPDTRLGDDSISVVLLKGTSRWALVRYGFALLTNRVAKLPDATLLRARRVRIDGPVGEPIQSDGDLIGQAPMEIALGSRPLRILVPDLSRVLVPTSTAIAPPVVEQPVYGKS